MVGRGCTGKSNPCCDDGGAASFEFDRQQCRATIVRKNEWLVLFVFNWPLSGVPGTVNLSSDQARKLQPKALKMSG